MLFAANGVAAADGPPVAARSAAASEAASRPPQGFFVTAGPGAGVRTEATIPSTFLLCISGFASDARSETLGQMQ